MESHDERQHHGDGLPEHRRLRLDASDAPPGDAESVDHRRVAVGAHAAVGVHERLLLVSVRLLGGVDDDARKVLEVDLVHDTGTWRHDAEVLERLASPLDELEALLVALHLERLVLLHSLRVVVDIHLNAVVDDEVDGNERVHLLRVSAQSRHGIAHCREVDDGGNACEVLKHDTCRYERHFHLSCGISAVRQNLLHVIFGDEWPHCHLVERARDSVVFGDPS